MTTWDLNAVHAFILEKAACARSVNPVAIAIQIMRCPEIRMHGPEHHFLTGASLCAAWCRAQQLAPAPFLEKLLPRCVKIPPAVCGYYGVCGDTMAVGAAVSVMLGTTYLSGEEWRLTGSVTAHVQKAVASTPGPRCCKRSTTSALTAATDTIRRLLGVPIERTEKIFCGFSRNNKECLKTACAFYKESVDGETAL